MTNALGTTPWQQLATVKFSVKLSFSDNVGHWEAIKVLKVSSSFVVYVSDVRHLVLSFFITRGHLLLFSEIHKNKTKVTIGSQEVQGNGLNELMDD